MNLASLRRFVCGLLGGARQAAPRPAADDADLAAARRALEAGRAGDAEALLRTILARRADDVEALRLLARVLRSLDRLQEAAACHARILAIRPQLHSAYVELGVVLNDQGKPAEAGICFQRALELEPQDADALANLGNSLQYQGRLAEAVACYRKAIARDPGYVQAHHNLGNALDALDRREEALESFARALALDGEFVEARWALAMSQLKKVYADADEARACRAAFARQLGELERWFEGGRSAHGHRAVGIQQPFGLAYQEEDNREIYERYGRLCSRLMATWLDGQGIAPPAKRPHAGPIRVGVVSQYFREHSVWNALARGWFEKLDPERFALHAFYLGAHEDAQTARCRQRAARFHAGAGGLRAWVDAILGAGLDVLIYPEIGMDPMTVKLASLRLAPVQLAAWGHPETTGLPTIDGYLSAEGMEPADAQRSYSEELVPLPNLGCWISPAARIADASAPEGLDAPSEHPLLVCPGTPFKYAPRHDALYAQIARRLGRCRLLFFTHQGRDDLSARLLDRLRRAFGAAGLRADDHVVFLPWQERRAFHGLMQRADVFLDTIGFSGFNTALQAVDCALPIATREGRFLRGRFAAGILRRIGLEELVAQTDEDYVRIAVRLAQDSGYRERIREHMRRHRGVLFADEAPIQALQRYLERAAA